MVSFLLETKHKVLGVFVFKTLRVGWWTLKTTLGKRVLLTLTE